MTRKPVTPGTRAAISRGLARKLGPTTGYDSKRRNPLSRAQTATNITAKAHAGFVAGKFSKAERNRRTRAAADVKNPHTPVSKAEAMAMPPMDMNSAIKRMLSAGTDKDGVMNSTIPKAPRTKTSGIKNPAIAKVRK